MRLLLGGRFFAGSNATCGRAVTYPRLQQSAWLASNSEGGLRGSGEPRGVGCWEEMRLLPAQAGSSQIAGWATAKPASQSTPLAPSSTTLASGEAGEAGCSAVASGPLLGFRLLLLQPPR